MFSQHLHSMSSSLSKYTLLTSIYLSFPAAVNRSLCTEPIRDRERDCDRRTHTSVAKDGAGVKCGDWQLVLTSLWTILGNCESCTSKSEVCSDCVSVWQVVVENDWTSTENPYLRSGGKEWPHSAPDPPVTNTAELSGWQRMWPASHGKTDHSPAKEKTHSIITRNI